MNRRAFVKALLGSAAAASVLSRFELPEAITGAAEVTAPLAPKWAIAGEAFRKGDVFSISGVHAVNPLTGAVTERLQRFVITADVSADADLRNDNLIFPRLMIDGPYRNVSNIPADDAELLIESTGPWIPCEVAFTG